MVDSLDQSALLNQLLLQLLGGQQADPLKAAAGLGANPLLNAVAGGGQRVPPTQYITHTSTYVTTMTNTMSKILPITLRGIEIKTTLVESKTEVVTATDYSTETIIAPTASLPLGLGALGGLGAPTQLPGAGDLQQQLLLAQLQQQLQQQQQLNLNQQILSQVNLEPSGQQQPAAATVTATATSTAAAATTTTAAVTATVVSVTSNVGSEPPAPAATSSATPEPVTSVVTKFVSGKNPGEFHVVTSTVTVEPSKTDKSSRRRRDASDVKPSPVQPILKTASSLELHSSSSESADARPAPQPSAATLSFAAIELESGLASALPSGASASRVLSHVPTDALARTARAP
jgi:hypothetical protein